VKIGAVDTEIALLILKKEEINASKIYSPIGNLAERAKQKISWSLQQYVTFCRHIEITRERTDLLLIQQVAHSVGNVTTRW